MTKKLRYKLTLGLLVLGGALVGSGLSLSLRPYLVKAEMQKCVTLRIKGDQLHQSEFYTDEQDPRWLVVENPIEIKCLDKRPENPEPQMPSFRPSGPTV